MIEDIDSSTIALIISICTFLWSIYKFYRQNKFNQRSNRYKAELQKDINQISEQQKFENQKRLTDFGLYATKKHECYIELYEKLTIAISNIFWQAQLVKKQQTFTDYNCEDVKKFLNPIPITEKEKNRYLEIWNTDHKNGFKELRKLADRVHRVKTIDSVADASDSYLKARLYLPKNLAIEIEQYIEELYAFANEMKEYDELRENNRIEESEGNHQELKNRPVRAQNFAKRFEKITDKLQLELKE